MREQTINGLNIFFSSVAVFFFMLSAINSPEIILTITFFIVMLIMIIALIFHTSEYRKYKKKHKQKGIEVSPSTPSCRLKARTLI